VSREEEDESVVPKEVIRMAERLARERKVGGLRLLVRMALLPLQAQAAFLWTDQGKGLPHYLVDAIPAEVMRALEERGAKPLYLEPVRDGETPFLLDLGRHPAVSFPWNPDRVAHTLASIGEQEWRYDPENHRAHFYRPLGVAFFYNGLHSGMAGIRSGAPAPQMNPKGEGRLPATEVDLTPLYAAGLRVEWRTEGLFRGEEKPFAVLGKLARPMEHPHHALLLALGEVLHRHGISL
jgi:hypothetical protein